MEVEVKQGKLVGIKEKSVLNGYEYYSFLGIPYAQPPIDDLRFRPPVPIDKWNGVYEAKKEPAPCYQYDIMNNNELVGSEDCLYLNVFTPAAPSDIKVPKAVMVFIHGGGFLFGSSSPMTYSADYLMNYDVVLVTVNYRLHALGFLNMGIEDCPGNCGLKDQMTAFQWIKENIRQFGGDPGNVTIFGESAGASSVHWHMLSPLSKGLFEKAILQSGVTSCAWSFSSNPIENGFRLGRYLGFEEKDPKMLIEFLKKQPVKNILDATTKMYKDTLNELFGIAAAIPFAPSVETIKENAFITDVPENLCKNIPPVPTIAGINDKEGRLIFLSLMEKIVQIQADLTPVIKNNFQFKDSQLREVVNEVKKYYFANGGSISATFSALTDLYTDIYFRKFHPTIDYIANSNAPLYVYQFSFNGDLNPTKRLMLQPFKYLFAEGASHADELAYLFYPKSLPDPKFGKCETKVIENMCTLWTNFAKTGNPNGETISIEWKPYTSEKSCYLQIKDDLKLIQGSLLEKGSTFWKKIEEKYK